MKRKIKWKNLGYLFILLTSLTIILHDFYKLIIDPIFTGNLTTLTLFGVITLGISFITLNGSFEALFEQYKKCA